MDEKKKLQELENEYTNKEVAFLMEGIQKEFGEEIAQSISVIADGIFKKGISPKDAMGVKPEVMEGIYSQAYRLFNSGKYKDAGNLFRMLVLLDASEAKYMMGLAACFHMEKKYKTAAQIYGIILSIDPQDPLPHYHAADCYVNDGNKEDAINTLYLAAAIAGDREEFALLKERCRAMIESLEEGDEKKSKSKGTKKKKKKKIKGEKKKTTNKKKGH